MEKKWFEKISDQVKSFSVEDVRLIEIFSGKHEQISPSDKIQEMAVV